MRFQCLSLLRREHLSTSCYDVLQWLDRISTMGFDDNLETLCRFPRLLGMNLDQMVSDRATSCEELVAYVAQITSVSVDTLVLGRVFRVFRPFGISSLLLLVLPAQCF